ncbi:chorion protein S38-like [Teleopsis dalmanni]|uniref:chorion protein S38-like n=1 Tax=Teleopsis dalmanni TaxID=139649 RepID=UPI0018CC98D8|nr:chorion protein S38-like [Teleopsis dalmanni]XP_037937849.1 chorion protein S38 [Teleopsis dalmanni]XP_037942485.1 chorion protein S38-like [Teleopsis dalmanni]
MNRFNYLIALTVALAAIGPVYSSYGAQVPAVEPSYAAPVAYGVPNKNVPYSPANTRGNTVTSSITYPQNKGEILIHRPAAIIVKRPPTKVLVNHPPLVVRPAPVVLHKPPAVVLRKVLVKHHPRPVKVEPVYVNVVKPPAEKYFVNEKQQQLAGAQLPSVPVGFAPIGNLPASAAASADGSLSSGLAGLSGLGNSPAAAAAGPAGASANTGGYQLLPGSHGLASLAGITGQGGYAPSPYGAPNY